MSLSDNLRKQIAIAIVLSISASIAFKSVIFVEGEPVVINYIFSSAIVIILGSFLLFTRGLLPIERTTALLVASALGWAALSSLMSPIALNLAAAAAFIVLAVGFCFFMPILAFRSGSELWRSLNLVLTALSLIGVIMLALNLPLAIDPDSGRFRGPYVSVAVACTMFALNALFAMRAALGAKSSAAAFGWTAVFLIAVAELYLTRTRSSLAELMVGLAILFIFAPLSRGMRMITLGGATIGLVASAASLGAVSTGVVQIDEQLRAFRLADTELTASRDDNWLFGLERIAARPLFGEGLLTKQTRGGTTDVNFGAESNYDPRYDPHSQALTNGVQAGIPFMVIMLAIFIYVPAAFVRIFGLKEACRAPEFIFIVVRLTISMFSGGDMTSLGSFGDKVAWMMIGMLALKTELGRRAAKARGRQANRPIRVAPPSRRLPAPALLPSATGG